MISMNLKNYFLLVFTSVVLLLLAGVVTAFYTARSADLAMRHQLLLQATLAGNSINPRHVTELTGSKKDLLSPGYQNLKEQLVRLRSTDPRYRFFYLAAQRSNGEINFIVDSEQPESKD